MPCDRFVNRRNSQLQNFPISPHYSEVPKFKLTVKKDEQISSLKLIEEQTTPDESTRELSRAFIRMVTHWSFTHAQTKKIAF